MVPARRKYLLTFQGEMKRSPLKESTYYSTAENQHNSKNSEYVELDRFIVEHLKGLVIGMTNDKFLFEFECIPASDDSMNTGELDWGLCGTDSSRKAVLKESTFTLIFAPRSAELLTTSLLQARVYEALRAGAIPVILGGDQIQLAYNEVIQWKRVCVFLPRARVTELHFLLRTIPDNDIIVMRRQGRMIWERYLASVQSTLDTVIAILRERLNIPPLPVETIPAISVFNDTFQPIQTIITLDTDPEESLGPLEPPYNSPAFKRNFSLFLTQSHQIWNDYGDPFHLYPTLPTDPLLPSDAKFIGSNRGFRPIGRGQGGKILALVRVFCLMNTFRFRKRILRGIRW